MNLLKSILLGIIQGITEWLPVSSTGHLLLYDAFFPLDTTEEFRNLFLVVIQFFSVLAILILYKDRLLPQKGNREENQKKIYLYIKILIAAIPGIVLGFFFSDLIEALLYTPTVIAITLITYGVLFIIAEKKAKNVVYFEAEDVSVKSAFGIGIFQALALIPGTSRSGATVFGGRQLALSRKAATEFSFFLAIPMMTGASGYRLLKFFLSGGSVAREELLLLSAGGITSFLVSMVTVRFLLDFVKAHSFRIFGYYRILLGIAVLVLFTRI